MMRLGTSAALITFSLLAACVPYSKEGDTQTCTGVAYWSLGNVPPKSELCTQSDEQKAEVQRRIEQGQRESQARRAQQNVLYSPAQRLQMANTVVRRTPITAQMRKDAASQFAFSEGSRLRETMAESINKCLHGTIYGDSVSEWLAVQIPEESIYAEAAQELTLAATDTELAQAYQAPGPVTFPVYLPPPEDGLRWALQDLMKNYAATHPADVQNFTRGFIASNSYCTGRSQATPPSNTASREYNDLYRDDVARRHAQGASYAEIFAYDAVLPKSEEQLRADAISRDTQARMKSDMRKNDPIQRSINATKNYTPPKLNTTPRSITP